MRESATLQNALQILGNGLPLLQRVTTERGNASTLSGREDRALRCRHKIAAYMRVPRTAVIRRHNRLQRWGLIDRRGLCYYINVNSIRLWGWEATKKCDAF